MIMNRRELIGMLMAAPVAAVTAQKALSESLSAPETTKVYCKDFSIGLPGDPPDGTGHTWEYEVPSVGPSTLLPDMDTYTESPSGKRWRTAYFPDKNKNGS